MPADGATGQGGVLGWVAVTTTGWTWGPVWHAQGERPVRMKDVSFGRLPAPLRLLLASEGTLAGALEAFCLAPVVADVEGHEPMRLDVDHARWLHSHPGDTAVSRRTALRDAASGRLLVHADSVLLPDRLPPSFITVLADSPGGLGEAFARLSLESRRELLWFGRTPLRGLREGDRALAGPTGVSRCYRLIVDSVPVCCIEESFPDPVFGPPGSDARAGDGRVG